MHYKMYIKIVLFIDLYLKRVGTVYKIRYNKIKQNGAIVFCANTKKKNILELEITYNLNYYNNNTHNNNT